MANLEKIYRYIFEKSPIAIFFYDNELKIRFFNDKCLEILKVRKEQLEGFDINKVIDRSILDCIKKPILEKKDGFFEGWYHTTLSDRLIYAYLTTTPYFDDDGNVIGGIGVINDLTLLKRAHDEKLEVEKKLQHLQRLETIGVLAGGIAHDFNNILMAILGNSEIAIMKLNQTSPAIENLRKIQKATEKAADLCKQLLAYAGKGIYNVLHLDLNKLINDILYIIEVSVSKKILIKYNLKDDIPLIMADSTQINQIIMNLITNASEAIGDKGGIITITTGVMECDENYLKNTFVGEDLPEGKYCFLEVSDNGCGMDDETKNKMFDPFFTTKFIGRGLGLSAVLGIVRSHHGSIKVYTEKGKGTTIKVLFPAIEERNLSNNETVEFQKEFAIYSNKKYEGTVLLVDDEDHVRQATKEQLEILGLTVMLSGHTNEALNIYRDNKEKIDLVILDLILPEIDGIECFRELRRINSEVKVIVVSGYNVDDIRDYFNGKGVYGFLQKPFSLKELEKFIKKVFN